MDNKDIRRRIVAFLEETFLFSFLEDKVSDQENLFEAGYIDSYGLVQLLTFLESEFLITIPENMMSSPKLASLSGIIELVEERLAVES